jgi:hypothetical protein
MSTVTWIDRERVLSPLAACARGEQTLALANKLYSWTADRLAKLSGVATADALVVLAKLEDDLPWIDGIKYLGKDPLAPQLLLPTASRPDVHASLFERAITQKARTIGLIAVLPDPPPAIIPLRNALPLSHTKLRELLEHRR